MENERAPAERCWASMFSLAVLSGAAGIVTDVCSATGYEEITKAGVFKKRRTGQRGEESWEGCGGAQCRIYRTTSKARKQVFGKKGGVGRCMSGDVGLEMGQASQCLEFPGFTGSLAAGGQAGRLQWQWPVFSCWRLTLAALAGGDLSGLWWRAARLWPVIVLHFITPTIGQDGYYVYHACSHAKPS